MTSDPRRFLYRPDGLDPDAALRLTADALKGCDDGELYLQYTASESFSFDDGRLKSADFNTQAGFGLRGVSGETTAFEVVLPSPRLGELELEIRYQLPRTSTASRVELPLVQPVGAVVASNSLHLIAPTDLELNVSGEAWKPAPSATQSGPSTWLAETAAPAALVAPAARQTPSPARPRHAIPPSVRNLRQPGDLAPRETHGFASRPHSRFAVIGGTPQRGSDLRC